MNWLRGGMVGKFDKRAHSTSSDVRRWGHAAKNVSTFSNPKSGNGFALGLCAVR